MAQADGVVSNASGAAVRADLNNQLAAAFTNHSGATEPATTYAYQWWADTTTGLLKIRNAANTDWVTVGTLASANLGLLSASGGTLTGALLADDGTESLPSIAFVGDTNTGIYSPGGDQFAVSTNGTQRLLIEADGDISLDNGGVFYDATNNRLGIGTSAPTVKLEVAGQIRGLDGGIDLRLNPLAGSGAGIIGTYSNHDLVLNTNSAEKARIDSSGRLLVGTSTARSNLFNGSVTAAHQVEVSAINTAEFLGVRNYDNTTGADLVLAKSRGSAAGSNVVVQSGDSMGTVAFMGSDGSEFVPGARIAAIVDGTPGADDMPGRLVFSTTADGGATPAERMRIQANGSILLIGTDEGDIQAGTLSGKSITGGTAIMYSSRATVSATPHIIFTNTNGSVGSISTSGSATAYNTSSDYRLKENVVPLTGAADRLNQLQVHRFNFIADPDTTVDGFIAHEAQTVVPECVTGTKDEVGDDGNPVYQGIDQSKLVPLLTAALQEALQKIETLEQRLNDAGIA
jgi:hypothetical protein